MYEKPQYLTSDGFRRSEKNPAKAKGQKEAATKARKGLVDVSRKKLAQVTSARREISPEAARLIAQAIRGMLRQK